MARTTSKKPMGGDPAPMFTMTRLAQVRALSDPLRVKILESLCLEPRTTKQVAELLGEKPTRLYHHVEALARVGLIRLTETRPVRGTVEKYYRAVALSFRADPSIFQQERSGNAEREVLTGVATTLLERTAEELRELIRSGGDVTNQEEGLLSHIEVRSSEKEIRALQAKLQKVIDQVQGKDSPSAKPDGLRRYRLTIAYFPLDVGDTAKPGSPMGRRPRTRRD